MTSFYVLKHDLNVILKDINGLCNSSPRSIGVFKCAKRGHKCIRENGVCTKTTQKKYAQVVKRFFSAF